MKRSGLAIGLAMMTLGSVVARADVPAEIGDGAAAYASIQLGELAQTLKRAGLEEMEGFIALKQQLGGINILDPGLLAPTGIDASAPVWASLFETSKIGDVYHHRLVVALKDSGLFSAFVGGVVASGQAPLVAADALSQKAGVIATAKLPDGGTAILRVSGTHAVVDGESRWDGKPVVATKLAAKYPLSPRKKFIPGGAAAKIVAEPGAMYTLLAYFDARRAPEAVAALHRVEAKRWLKQGGAEARKKLTAFEACKRELDASPSELADATLLLRSQPGEASLSLSWSAKRELWPSEPASLISDVDKLEGANALGWIDIARAMQVGKLVGTGVFSTRARVESAGTRCEPYFVATSLTRAWPNVLSAYVRADKKELTQAAGAFGQAAESLLKPGALRQLIGAVPPGPPETIKSTFVGALVLDPSLADLVKMLVGLLGEGASLSTAIDSTGDRLLAIGGSSQQAVNWMRSTLNATRARRLVEPIVSLQGNGGLARALLSPGAGLEKITARIAQATLTLGEANRNVELLLKLALRK